MKSKKKRAILIAFIIIFLFSSIYINRVSKDVKNLLELNQKNQIQIKQSGQWDLTGSTIFIDNTNPNYNWSKTAFENEWCSGSGTWNDPYKIENITIDAQGSDNCIEIRNSDVYFIIQNCTLYNSGYSPVKLYHVDNGKIINNNCFGSLRERAIFLYYSDNNTLSGNTVSNNYDYGILLTRSNNNTLSGNIAYNNNDDGICLYYSYNNILSMNLMNSCGISLIGSLAELASHDIDDTNLINGKTVYYYVNEKGLGSSNFTDAGQIILVNCSNSIISGLNLSNIITGLNLYYSNNNILSGNTASNNNENGILLMESSNNTLSGNIVNNNNDNGILLDNSNNNTLSKNKASHNHDYGVYLDNSHYNLLSGNSINNSYAGICIWYSEENTLSGNLMNSCGIYQTGSLANLASHDIDDTNLVNGNSVYYYVNEKGLGSSNFTDAGQVILVNCSNSIISGLNLSNGTTGIFLYYCKNNTLSDNDASNNNRYGIEVSFSENNKLSGNIANNNYLGIALISSNNNNLSENIASNNNRYGILLDNSDNNNLSANTANNNNFYGIYLVGGSNDNKLLGNVASENDGSGLYLSNSNINTILENIMYKNNRGMWLANSNYNNISGNTVNNNQDQGIILDHGYNNLLTGNTANNNHIGINLYYSNNNTLLGNNAYKNNNFGIFLVDDSDYNILSGNSASSNSYYGIFLFNSDYNTLSGNNASSNSHYGINLYNSDNNTLSGNIANNNNEFGIYLSYSNKNMLFANIMLYSGIFIEGSLVEMASHIITDKNLVNNNPVYYYVNDLGLLTSNFTNAGQILLINCSHSIIIKLNLSNGSGIFLFYCYDITISESRIINNLFGIILDSNCFNNQFFLNNFCNNGINAEDNGINNEWDNGTIGNYWDDYVGVDANDDGIGDTPYIISGTAHSKDNFPIWDDGIETLNSTPTISFGNYYLLIASITLLSLVIFEKQKSKKRLF